MFSQIFLTLVFPNFYRTSNYKEQVGTCTDLHSQALREVGTRLVQARSLAPERKHQLKHT